MNFKRLAYLAGIALLFNTSFASAKTLVYCSEASPETFNGALTTSGQTMDASSKNVFNNLVEFERGETKIIPGLAESWTISDDGKTYTFKLRKGVKFHKTKYFTPTRDFNAKDVLFTFARQWRPEHSYHKVSGGTYTYFSAMGMDKLIKSIDRVDDYTVRFILNKPEAPFLANLAMPFAPITSQEYAKHLEKKGQKDQYDLKPIGTGPFQFVGYKKDSTIRYKAHPDYWRGKAPIDNLIFAITPDATVRYAKLKSGECHVMPYPNLADVKSMKADEEITVYEQEGLNVGFLALNTNKKPLDNVKVRQALDYAVNKQAIVDAVYQGAAMIAKNPMPPTIWSYNDKTPDHEYNVEKAKALLKEAGVENGFEVDIWAMAAQRPYNPNPRRMAEMIQEDWSKIGVKSNIVTYEWGEHVKRTKNGEHTTAFYGWTGDNGDPDNFLHTLLSCDAAKSGLNRAQWCNESFDEIVTAAKRIADLKKRSILYKKAQEITNKQIPYITIAHTTVYKPVRKEVLNYKIDPFGLHPFYGVDLKE